MVTRLLQILTFVCLLQSCSSPDEEARELIAEARVLYKGCDSINYYTAENEVVENCIEILAKASNYMEILFESYGATPASNEILTHQLKGKIRSRLIRFKLGLKEKNAPEKVWDSGPTIDW